MVTTHRISELLLTANPLASVLLDLQAKGISRELPLAFLEPVDVERYLELEFPGHDFPRAFAAVVHTRSEGSPLFMVDMLADLRERGVIGQHPTWRLTDEMSAVERRLPASIRSMIERRLDHVGTDDLRLLRIASVQGHEFDANVVAEAAELDAVTVEERLEILDRVHSLVRIVGERELPDGEVTARYQFVHGLYQNALYASLTPARRSAYSMAVARSLQSHHERQGGLVAARVAVLYETARQFRLAAEAYAAAAEHAAQFVAHREAAVLARRGLATLQYLPESRDRAELELGLHIRLGVALLVTQGYTSREGQQVYFRARDLCRVLENRAELFPVTWGLWMYAICTADFTVAGELAKELIDLSQAGRQQDRVRAGWAAGTTALHVGRPVEALRHFEWGLQNYRESDDRTDRHLYGHDAGITCRSFAALTRWFLGEPDDVVAAAADRACDDAAQLSHAQSMAFSLLMAANVHACRGDAKRSLVRALEAVRIAEHEGLPELREWSRSQLGWATAQQGQIEEGLAMTTEALEALSRFGTAAGRPYFAATRADILVAHRPTEAIEGLDDALKDAQTSGEVMYYPELLRLKARAVASLGDHVTAKRLLDEAIDRAMAQGSLGLAQRARSALAQLLNASPTP